MSPSLYEIASNKRVKISEMLGHSLQTKKNITGISPEFKGQKVTVINVTANYVTIKNLNGDRVTLENYKNIFVNP